MFWIALRNTLIYTAIALPMGLVVALWFDQVLALLGGIIPLATVSYSGLSSGRPGTIARKPDVAMIDSDTQSLWSVDGRCLEGYAKGNRNDVWHSADGVTWHEVPKTPWRPRHAASVYVHDDALWMVAGNNMFSDVWKLTRADRR